MMKTIAAALCVTAFAGAAHGQYYSGFEAPQYSGSAAGTVATGQDGWYLPVAGSADFNIYTYAGNALGLPQNPVGGNMFIGGTSLGTDLARAQRDVSFSAGTWTIAYDFAATWLGTGTSGSFLGSFSIQDAGGAAARTFISLMDFVDQANPAAGYDLTFVVHDAGGTQVSLPGLSAGSAWEGLNINHWYRQYITIDFNANLITEVTLVDLHTGSSSSASPSDWYLAGGAGSTLPLPDAVRFFAGGANVGGGNTMGFDNLFVIPAPGAMGLLAIGGLVALRRRR